MISFKHTIVTFFFALFLVASTTLTAQITPLSNASGLLPPEGYTAHQDSAAALLSLLGPGLQDSFAIFSAGTYQLAGHYGSDFLANEVTRLEAQAAARKPYYLLFVWHSDNLHLAKSVDVKLKLPKGGFFGCMGELKRNSVIAQIIQLVKSKIPPQNSPGLFAESEAEAIKTLNAFIRTSKICCAAGTCNTCPTKAERAALLSNYVFEDLGEVVFNKEALSTTIAQKNGGLIGDGIQTSVVLFEQTFDLASVIQQITVDTPSLRIHALLVHDTLLCDPANWLGKFQSSPSPDASVVSKLYVLITESNHLLVQGDLRAVNAFVSYLFKNTKLALLFVNTGGVIEKSGTTDALSCGIDEFKDGGCFFTPDRKLVNFSNYMIPKVLAIYLNSQNPRGNTDSNRIFPDGCLYEFTIAGKTYGAVYTKNFVSGSPHLFLGYYDVAVVKGIRKVLGEYFVSNSLPDEAKYPVNYVNTCDVNYFERLSENAFMEYKGRVQNTSSSNQITYSPDLFDATFVFPDRCHLCAEKSSNNVKYGDLVYGNIVVDGISPNTFTKDQRQERLMWACKDAALIGQIYETTGFSYKGIMDLLLIDYVHSSGFDPKAWYPQLEQYTAYLKFYISGIIDTPVEVQKALVGLVFTFDEEYINKMPVDIRMQAIRFLAAGKIKSSNWFRGKYKDNERAIIRLLENLDNTDKNSLKKLAFELKSDVVLFTRMINEFNEVNLLGSDDDNFGHFVRALARLFREVPEVLDPKLGGQLTLDDVGDNIFRLNYFPLIGGECKANCRANITSPQSNALAIGSTTFSVVIDLPSITQTYSQSGSGLTGHHSCSCTYGKTPSLKLDYDLFDWVAIADVSFNSSNTGNSV